YDFQVLGAERDVHVVVAALDRLEQHAAPLRVVVVPAPAVGDRERREQQRLRLTAQDLEQVEVEHQVGADLEQVGDARELLHALDGARRRLLGQADADLSHRNKKASSGSLKRLSHAVRPFSPGNPCGPPGPAATRGSGDGRTDANVPTRKPLQGRLACRTWATYKRRL